MAEWPTPRGMPDSDGLPAPPGPVVTRTIVVATVVLLSVIAAGFAGLDRWFYETISLRLNTPNPVDADFYHVTKLFWSLVRMYAHLIGVGAAWCAVLVFHRRSWLAANTLLCAALTAGLVANVAQGAIGRTRPNHATTARQFSPPLTGLLSPHADGFPSGEVATATALSFVLARLWPGWRVVAWSTVVLVAGGRVLPGMHYLSDAAAGVLLGAGVGLGCMRLLAGAPRLQRGRSTLRGRRRPP